MAAAAVTACTANYRPDPFDLLNADIEALAQDESLDPRESSTSKWLTMSRYCSCLLYTSHMVRIFVGAEFVPDKRIDRTVCRHPA